MSKKAVLYPPQHLLRQANFFEGNLIVRMNPPLFDDIRLGFRERHSAFPPLFLKDDNQSAIYHIIRRARAFTTN
jgi:hypothetical protein